jgi:hypothetical protein
VAQHHQLGVLCRRASGQQGKPPPHLAEQQLPQSNSHVPIIVARQRRWRTCSSAPTTDFLAPTGKFCRGFDDLFRGEGAEVLVTPVQAPNANAYAERWVRTVRTECLDWLLIVSRGHLERVLWIYVQHYNQHRPHRALGLEPPRPSADLPLVGEARRARVRRRDLLGGVLHEYQRAA